MKHHKKHNPHKRRAEHPISPHLAVFGIVTIVALVILFALVSRFFVVPSPSITRSHEIGEIVTVNKLYSIAVSKAVFDNSIAPKLHLPATQRVVVIDAQITNISNHTLNFLPAIHTFMRDDQANTYSFTPGLTSDSMPARLIAPNETVHGSLSFVVPSEYTPLRFYFDAQFDNQGPVSFRIVK